MEFLGCLEELACCFACAWCCNKAVDKATKKDREPYAAAGPQQQLYDSQGRPVQQYYDAQGRPVVAAAAQSQPYNNHQPAPYYNNQAPQYQSNQAPQYQGNQAPQSYNNQPPQGYNYNGGQYPGQQYAGPGTPVPPSKRQ